MKVTRDLLLLKPGADKAPGLRPGRTRHAKRDLINVQGPLRSSLRSAAQGRALTAPKRHTDSI